MKLENRVILEYTKGTRYIDIAHKLGVGVASIRNVLSRRGIKPFRGYRDGKNRTNHYLYTTWEKMIYRCYYKHHLSYKYYGERGISICDRWLSNFWNFVEDMEPRPIGLTLDRINNNGNYEPSNCRWVDHKTQMNNTRKQKGLDK